MMKLDWKRGFGTYDLDSIWIRGSEIGAARIKCWRIGRQQRLPCPLGIGRSPV